MKSLGPIVTAAILAAAPVQVAKKPTAISFTASAASLRQGSKISFTGVLKAKGLKSAVVTISFRKKGTTKFVTAGTVKTTATGRFTWTPEARNTGLWKATFRGGSGFRAAEASKAVTVTALRPRLLGGLSGKGLVDDDPETAQLQSNYFGGALLPAPGKDYTVKWSYSCPDVAPDTWHLYWSASGAGQLFDIAQVRFKTSGAGTYVGHDGDPDLNDDEPWLRLLTVDIFGTGAGTCTTDVKVYSGTTRVPV